MGVRQAVADAVNTAAIAGVAGSVWPPPVKSPGAVWAKWVTTEVTVQAVPGRAVETVETWSVLVMLPDTTQKDTSMALDTWLPLLLDALAPLFTIGTAAPEPVDMGDGTSPAPAISIQITV